MRRISPVTLRPAKCPLTEPTTDAPPRRQGLVKAMRTCRLRSLHSTGSLRASAFNGTASPIRWAAKAFGGISVTTGNAALRSGHHSGHCGSAPLRAGSQEDVDECDFFFRTLRIFGFNVICDRA